MKKISGISILRIIVIVLSVTLFSTFLSPQIALFGRGLRLSLPLFVLLITTTILVKANKLTRLLINQIGPLWFGVTFIGIGLLRYSFDSNTDWFHSYVVSASVCFGIWLCILIIKNIFPDSLEFIRWLSLILFGIGLGLGIPFLISEPGIARLTMGRPDANIYLSLYFPHGIANYSWYTPAAFAFPVIANWLYKSQISTAKRLLGWGALIAVSIAILLSTFTMAMFFLLVGILSWIFFVLMNNKSLRSRIVAFFILMIFGVSFSSLYLFGREYAPTEFAVDRVSKFFTVFQATNNLVEADPTIRTTLFLKTLKTFERNPLIGAWGVSTNAFSGGHSSWADTLALHGLLGIFLWFGFLSPSLRRGKHPFSVSEGNVGGTISWVLLLVGGIYNPTFFEGIGLLLLMLYDVKDLGNSKAINNNKDISPIRHK